MVKLADTLDLGSSARACRFKSCHPHQKKPAKKIYGLKSQSLCGLWGLLHKEVEALISLIYQPSCFTLAGVERASGQNDRINHKTAINTKTMRCPFWNGRNALRKVAPFLYKTWKPLISPWSPFWNPCKLPSNRGLIAKSSALLRSKLIWSELI